jgi:hypothetical protein
MILHPCVSLYPYHKISDDEISTEARQEGGSAQNPSGKIMAPWMFDVKFSCGIQLTFGSLSFTAGEDGDLKMLLLEAVPERLALEHGQASCSLANSSTSGDACLGVDPWVGLYIRTAKLVRDIPVVTSIIRPLAGTSSSSSSAASPEQDSSDDYPRSG